jgi:hypothetical protein
MLDSPHAWQALEAARHVAINYRRDIDALYEVARLMDESRDERSALGVDVRLVRTADGAWDVDGRFITA